MSSFDMDVLVIGAGPTGLTLANLLGAYGISVMIAERNPTTVEEPRAVSIDDESLRTMQAAGLIDVILPLISRGYGSRYLDLDGRCFAVVEPQTRDYGFDKRNGFRQPEIEAVLRDGLERFANVQVNFGTTLTGFVHDDQGVVAQFAGPYGAREIRARYMVGCDGGRSFTRKALGVALVGSTYRERWLIVDIDRTANRLRHTEVFCNPHRPCITLPGPNGFRRYEFMLHEGEDEENLLAEDAVCRLLASAGPDADAPIGRKRVYTFHARLADRWREGRVFLAGDAAHLTPPFAGQGMNSGIRDAHNLAWKLAHAIRHAVPDDFLHSYQRERAPHVRAMIDLALTMGRIMMPGSRLQARLTSTGFRMLGAVPQVRDYFAQMRYKPQPYFREGLLWPDGRNARETLVGRLLPQPLVEDVERRRVLLDELLGPSVSLLVISERPDAAINDELIRSMAARNIPIVGLTSDAINPVRCGFDVVRELSAGLSGRGPYAYREHALLIRPDRYVAATAPLDRPDLLEPALATLCPAGRQAELSETRPSQLHAIGS